jgi:hypothetical protein
LVKKNTAPHDLRPSDVLIERFVAWKAIVKQLIAYFEGIADIENTTAKELTKLGAVIQVPFRSGNQFLGEGGIQVQSSVARVSSSSDAVFKDVYYAIRDKTRVIADQHANLGRTIDHSIVQHLQKLRTEIKAHIKVIGSSSAALGMSLWSSIGCTRFPGRQQYAYAQKWAVRPRSLTKGTCVDLHSNAAHSVLT